MRTVVAVSSATIVVWLLYGTARLIEDKKQFQKRLDIQELNDEIIRNREEVTEQIHALQDFEKMCAAYGFDVTRPAKDAREAVQFVYLAYLAAVKDQDGAAMSIGRTSTFLDIYIEKDIREGKLTEEEAQELVDQMIIKLRIVRFLRTPEYNDLFSGDPVWVTESLEWNGHRRPHVGDEDLLPLPAYALQPQAGSRAELDGTVGGQIAGELEEVLCQGFYRHFGHPV